MTDGDREEWESTRGLIVAQRGSGKLSGALAAFQSEVGMISKDGRNEFHRYNYASLEQWVEAVRPVLARNGLAVITSCVRAEDLAALETAKGGALRLVRVTARATVLHVSGESLSLDAYGEGSDSGDKAVYKAMTGARKYLLAALSGSSTSDDPEHEPGRNGHDTGRAEPRKAQVAPAKASARGARETARPARSPDAISEAQRKRLWTLWSKRYEIECPGGSAESKEANLRELLGAHGYEHTTDIKSSAYDRIIEDIERWAIADLPKSPEWDRDA